MAAKDYLLSASGILKILRMIVAFMAAISFGAKRSHEAFLALAIMEFVITLLFFLLFLLSLDKKMSSFFWPLADAFNSLLAVLFLLIVGLCATLIKTILGTLVGGILCLVLCLLSLIDAIVVFKKISCNSAA